MADFARRGIPGRPLTGHDEGVDGAGPMLRVVLRGMRRVGGARPRAKQEPVNPANSTSQVPYTGSPMFPSRIGPA